MPEMNAIIDDVPPFNLDDVREVDILADVPGVYCVARLHMLDGTTYAEVTFGGEMECEDYAAVGDILPLYRFPASVGCTRILGCRGVTVRYLLAG
jgi:hypothetical protein